MALEELVRSDVRRDALLDLLARWLRLFNFLFFALKRRLFK